MSNRASVSLFSMHDILPVPLGTNSRPNTRTPSMCGARMTFALEDFGQTLAKSGSALQCSHSAPTRDVAPSLRRPWIALGFPQPILHAVPSGKNLGHQLQVVDSKRLKSPTHSVDRTAVTLLCGGLGTSVVQRSPEPLPFPTGARVENDSGEQSLNRLRWRSAELASGGADGSEA